MLSRTTTSCRSPEAGFGEGNVFRYRIILAIAFPGREGSKRSGPPVGFAMLRIVTNVTDGHIDRAIGFIQLFAAGLCLDGFDQAQKLLGMGWTPFGAFPTTIQPRNSEINWLGGRPDTLEKGSANRWNSRCASE